MDEFSKARLRLFVVFLLFVVFVFSLIFGAIKIYERLSGGEFDEDDTAVYFEEPQFDIPAKVPEKAKKVSETSVENHFADFDCSRTFKGILPAWKKYRRPRCGILADVTNKKILWSYNADRVVPIASMSKMLTIYMALDAMKRSSNMINLQSKVKVSANSASGREGGFGFRQGDVFVLEDLMKAAIIRSANDAAGAIAVYFGDGEERFVQLMNIEAKKLGMKKSSFINPHGLPQKNKDNLSTMNDMLLLSLRVLNEPIYMRFSKMRAAKIRGRTIVNTNNLMRRRKYPGVDGLKTGYTRRAGFCLAFSCLRDGRRLVGVVAGFPSAADRENFLTALLNWAYR